MKKRARRPVTPAQRMRWLEQLEGGERITKIAWDANRDIRTVKGHIEIAEQERAKRRALLDFRRSRLELHHEDLLKEASRLRSILVDAQAFRIHRDDPIQRRIHEAFKTHLGRSRLRRQLDSYLQMAERYRTEHARLRAELEQVQRDQVRGFPEKTVSENWHRIVLDVLDRCVKEDRDWNPCWEKMTQRDGHNFIWEEYNINHRPVDDDTFSGMGEIQNAFNAVAQACLPNMQRMHQEMKAAGAPIAEELEAFMVMRMVPGRCRYCPA